MHGRVFAPETAHASLKGTGSETVTTRAAACGLLVAAPRPSSRRVFHAARPSALDEAEAVDAAALAGASHARRCCHAAAAHCGAPGGHLHLWGGYTSVAESFLMACAPSVTLLGQRRSAWSLRASLLHACGSRAATLPGAGSRKSLDRTGAAEALTHQLLLRA